MVEERADGNYKVPSAPEVPTTASSVEEAPAPSEWRTEDICLTVSELYLYYGDNEALTDISMNVTRRRVTALIGPSGCGKSTLLRCFNRMNDLIDNVRITGEIELNGMEIHRTSVDIAQLRRRVGMVFQRPIHFPSQSTKTLPTVYDFKVDCLKAKSMTELNGLSKTLLFGKR